MEMPVAVERRAEEVQEGDATEPWAGRTWCLGIRGPARAVRTVTTDQARSMGRPAWAGSNQRSFAGSTSRGRSVQDRNVGKQRDATNHDKPRSHDTSRIAWAKLMARIGEGFPLECPERGGDIRLGADGRQAPARAK